MQKIIFSEEDIKKCEEFSEQSDTSFYAKRNQFNDDKRRADCKIGKIGELAAYYSLVDKYPNISYPDFKIYPPRQKSWDYDMKDDVFNLHIKAQEYLQSVKFGESWIFQNEDKHIFKEQTNKDYVAFVIVNWLQKYGIVKNILPVSLLHENKLFKKPVLAKLVSKSAVYYDDIKLLDCHLI